MSTSKRKLCYTNFVDLADNVSIDSSLDAPCTFELDFCGWQTFDNMTINGLQVTRTWRRARHTWPDAPNDVSYFHSNGTWFYNAMPINDYACSNFNWKRRSKYIC